MGGVGQLLEALWPRVHRLGHQYPHPTMRGPDGGRAAQLPPPEACDELIGRTSDGSKAQPTQPRILSPQQP
jgi:hypothetical protein